MVPAAPVDIYILPYDDIAGITGFTTVDGLLSVNATDYSEATPFAFSITTPVSALDFTDNTQSFYYKATVDLSGATSGEMQFLRLQLSDGQQQGVTTIPNMSSNYFWFLLLSLKVI